jgi:hypothetical protein
LIYTTFIAVLPSDLITVSGFDIPPKGSQRGNGKLGFRLPGTLRAQRVEARGCQRLVSE